MTAALPSAAARAPAAPHTDKWANSIILEQATIPPNDLSTKMSDLGINFDLKHATASPRHLRCLHHILCSLCDRQRALHRAPPLRAPPTERRLVRVQEGMAEGDPKELQDLHDPGRQGIEVRGRSMLAGCCTD
jgi:hypothetical protein